MHCYSQLNILTLLFLVKSISSSPVASSSTTTFSYHSSDATTAHTTTEAEYGLGLLSSLESPAEDIIERKPLHPIEIQEEINTLPYEISANSAESILHKLRPQDENTESTSGEAADLVPRDSQIDTDNPVANSDENIQINLHGMNKSLGRAKSDVDSYFNMNPEESGGDHDPNFVSMDPCPVLIILCFQDAEYCPAFHEYCDDSESQEARIKLTLECIFNLISGKGSANCSNLVGR